VIPSIEREILIDAPVDVVWRAVTEPSQISTWFSDEAELDLRPGGEGTLVFSDKPDQGAMSVHITVQVVEPQRRFTYRWLHPEGVEPKPGNSLLVEFTLAEEGEGTRLRVTESGQDEIGWPEADVANYVQDHTKGWTKHLNDLSKHAASSTR
jgi:uncharacterized protein YndB with AHSA1/START domain